MTPSGELVRCRALEPDSGLASGPGQLLYGGPGPGGPGQLPARPATRGTAHIACGVHTTLGNSNLSPQIK